MIVGILPRAPRFLTLEEAIILHAAAIDVFGGSHGVRDDGLLRSALAMPEQGFGGQYVHAVPFGMAAAYAFHICKDHPFIDGNKRTALTSCVVFLRMNGWNLEANDDETGDQILAIAEGRLDKAGLEEWLASKSRPRPTLELRDFLAGLTAERFKEKAEAMSAGGAAERLPSWQEAMAAIPIIAEILPAYSNALNEGREREAGELFGYANVFVMIYRIAEDLGYEW